MKGLVVVPVYNESVALPNVIPQLEEVTEYADILFIDDGSTDDSAKLLAKHNSRFLRHPINLGYEETLRTGMHYAVKMNYDFTAFFDADGQHRVSDLLSMIKVFVEGNYDFIIGSRYRNQTFVWNSRSLITTFFSKIASLLSGVCVTDVTCGLKLISTRWIPMLLSIPSEDLHAELIVSLARTNARIYELPVIIESRQGGHSMYHFEKALFYPLKTLLCIIVGYYSAKQYIPKKEFGS